MANDKNVPLKLRLTFNRDKVTSLDIDNLDSRARKKNPVDWKPRLFWYSNEWIRFQIMIN